MRIKGERRSIFVVNFPCAATFSRWPFKRGLGKILKIRDEPAPHSSFIYLALSGAVWGDFYP